LKEILATTDGKTGKIDEAENEDEEIPNLESNFEDV
jgi:hypothetical protein